jgi:hypothetical protein
MRLTLEHQAVFWRLLFWSVRESFVPGMFVDVDAALRPRDVAFRVSRDLDEMVIIEQAISVLLEGGAESLLCLTKADEREYLEVRNYDVEFSSRNELYKQAVRRKAWRERKASWRAEQQRTDTAPAPPLHAVQPTAKGQRRAG